MDISSDRGVKSERTNHSTEGGNWKAGFECHLSICPASESEYRGKGGLLGEDD